MANKAINIKEFKKNLAYYFSIFAIVFGSTFGSFNAANAGNVNQDDTGVTTYATANNVTFTATTASAVLGSAKTAVNMVNTSGTDTVFTLSGTNKLTLSGATFSLKALTDDSLTVAMTGAGTGLILAEATLGTVTITGSTATTTVDVTGVDTHTFTFNGSAADLGGLEVSATTTFSGAMGATYGLATVNVDTSTVATFSEGVTAVTITLTGDAIFKKEATATTIALVGGKATFSNTAIRTIAGAITDSGTTELAVFNSADDEAPSVATFSGAVTVDTISIGVTGATGGSAKFSSTVAGAVKIYGGEDATEDSKMEITADLTGAVLLTQASLGDAEIKTSGSTALSISGAITVATDGDGQVTAANTAGTTFAAIGTDAAKALTVTVSADADATFGSAVAANTLTITGTATVQAADNESEVIVMGASSILYIDNTLTNGVNVFNEVLTTRPTLASGAKIYMPENLKTTETLILFYGEDDVATIADDTTTVTEANAAIQDNAIMDYTAAADTDDNGSTVVTATYKSDATTASELGTTVNKAVAFKQALLAAISDTNVDATLENQFNNALNGIGGQGATADTGLANQVGVQTDGIAGSTLVTRAMTGTVQGIVSNRMASLRSGDAYVTGVAAGYGMSANSGFLQVFGSDITQKNTTVGSGTEYGYGAETKGYALGFDGITENGSVIGLSLSRSNTDVIGKGTGKSTNDIESYTASIYADKVTDKGYLEGSLTFGINDNATSRIVNTAGLNRSYKGSYDSGQVSLKIGGGVPKQMNNGAFITPFGSITGTLILTDSYTETSTTGSDNLRLKIALDDVASIVGSLGFKAHIVTNKGTPMISIAINNEFGDNTINSTNTYTGGGSAFTTSTKVEELSATLGLGYSFGSDRTSLNLGYEAEANQKDYLSHYGTLKLVHKF